MFTHSDSLSQNRCFELKHRKMLINENQVEEYVFERL